MRSKEYHLHTVYSKPVSDVMGEARPEHFQHHLLQVQAPVYSDHQMTEHPEPEWMSFAAEHHPQTREMQDRGYKVDHIVGAHPHQSHKGYEAAAEHISHKLQAHAAIRKDMDNHTTHHEVEEEVVVEKKPGILGRVRSAITK